MKLELRNVKTHADLSRETDCFSATLYADGQKAAYVQNDGQGGCHRYEWTSARLEREVGAHAQSQPTDYDFEKLDQLVDRLLAHSDMIRQLKRQTKRQTWFRLKTDPSDGTFRTVNAPFSPQVEKFLKDKYGDQLDLIVNKDLEAAIPFCQ